MYKKFVKIWMGIVGICVCSLFVSSIVIDPIGILESPQIRGLNNYKVEQNSYVYVYKPYQYLKSNADIVFVGSSRVHAGMKAEVSDKKLKVYNFGCSGMTLPHMEEILRFIYKANKPQEVWIGLDFFQFAADHFKSVKNGFSKERLNDLSLSSNTNTYLRAIKENFMLGKSLWPTIKMSLKNKDAGNINVDGWNAKDGGTTTCNEKAFYGAINQYKKAYNKWSFESESIKCLERIICEAKKNDVKVVVFMNPINIDLFALLNAADLYEDLEMVKKIIVNVVGTVYDFNFVNTLTTNRRQLYIDAAHYNATFGERIKNDIEIGKDTDALFVLTKENVIEKLNMQREGNDVWMKNNEKYIDELRLRIRSVEKIKIGALEEFLGF